MDDPTAGVEPGRLRLVGRLVEASNATFLCRGDDDRAFVYKPVDGEAPLWDFPDRTLANREVAAYRISAAAGFGVVPCTRLVEDAPLGLGAVQTWVEHAGSEVVDVVAPDAIPGGWHAVIRGVDGAERPVVLVHSDDPGLRRIALFDIVVNNADRKGGHLIVGADRIYGVDHGVTFHPEPKLRTVLWGWAAQPLTDAELALVLAARAATGELAGLLAPDEVAAYAARCDELLAARAFPAPRPGWPPIPWPPM